MDKIYELKFGESYKDHSTDYHITRVPGGWIFRRLCIEYNGSSQTSVFIPFSTEFQIK